MYLKMTIFWNDGVGFASNFSFLAGLPYFSSASRNFVFFVGWRGIWLEQDNAREVTLYTDRGRIPITERTSFSTLIPNRETSQNNRIMYRQKSWNGNWQISQCTPKHWREIWHFSLQERPEKILTVCHVTDALIGTSYIALIQWKTTVSL